MGDEVPISFLAHGGLMFPVHSCGPVADSPLQILLRCDRYCLAGAWQPWPVSADVGSTLCEPRSVQTQLVVASRVVSSPCRPIPIDRRLLIAALFPSWSNDIRGRQFWVPFLRVCLVRSSPVAVLLAMTLVSGWRFRPVGVRCAIFAAILFLPL